MFENLIGQEGPVGRLSLELTTKALPSSLLFYGPAYSGKLTAALEVARAITCLSGEATWSCSCSSCESQRLLQHPYTLLLGGRYFAREIAACGDVLRRVRKRPAQYLYIRAVRKLTRRFDPLLWEGNEPKYRSVASQVQEVEDLLADLLPERDLPEEARLAKLLSKIEELARKIVPAVPETIPIGQIRRATAWAYTTSGGSKKILIIESADRMIEASRNALLKVLEEPPRGLHFILTTTRRAAVIPTILSRVRTYHFVERDEERSREVLSKIFREEGGRTDGTAGAGGSLRDYFLAWEEHDADRLRQLAVRFLESLLSEHEPPTVPEDILEVVGSGSSFRTFLEELSFLLAAAVRRRPSAEGALADPEPGLARAERWASLLRQAAAQNEAYNQSVPLLLESLYYSMREIPA